MNQEELCGDTSLTTLAGNTEQPISHVIIFTPTSMSFQLEI